MTTDAEDACDTIASVVDVLRSGGIRTETVCKALAQVLGALVSEAPGHQRRVVIDTLKDTFEKSVAVHVAAVKAH